MTLVVLIHFKMQGRLYWKDTKDTDAGVHPVLSIKQTTKYMHCFGKSARILTINVILINPERHALCISSTELGDIRIYLYNFSFANE